MRSTSRTAAELRGPALIAGGGALAVAAGWLSAQRSPLLTSGAIVGAVAGALALRRSLVAVGILLAVVTFLPFGVLPLRLGVAPTLLDLATAVVFVVWLARLAAGASSARSISGRGTGVIAALIAFSAALGVAYVFSPEPLAPDETARSFTKVVAAHLVIVPVLGLVTRAAAVRRVVLTFLLFATFEAVIGLALYALPRDVAYRALVSLSLIGYPTGDSVLRYRPDTEILRAIGTSVDPNMLGALLLIAGAIVGTQLVAPRPLLPRRLWLLALAPILFCLLLSESRGAWLGLAGGLLFVSGLAYRRIWAFAAAAVPVALVTPAAWRFTQHLVSGLRAEDRAASMRLGEIENALAVIAQHPWFGVGWGGGQGVDLEFTLGVSNVFLTVAERSGLPAMLLYAGCWLALAATLWPALRPRIRAVDRSTDDGLLVGLCAALGGAFIAGMVDHHFVRFPHLVTLLWFIAALALTLAPPRAESSYA